MRLSALSPPVLPPPVGPGDRVGVAALSSRPDEAALARGSARLEDLGFEVCPAANLGCAWHGFAGEDQVRADAFHELVRSPDVRAIFFARGGHGVLRVLPLIDWELIAANPKAYVGYSDLTPLLLLIAERAGLVTFHGPMVGTDLAGDLQVRESDSLLGALAGRPDRHFDCRVETGSAATVSGRLLGGCLSLLVATLGTDFTPDLRGSILFVEDVNEPFYRLDRMLTQLRLSGSLDEVKGMILGHLESHGAHRDESQAITEAGAPEGGWPIPVATGIAAGHGSPNLTLGLGLPAILDPRAGSLELLDPAATAA